MKAAFLCFCIAFADIITSTTPQNPQCEKIINGEPFTEGMEKGVLETSNYTFNKDIWKNKTTVRCSVPNSIPWSDKIMLSISAIQKDGTISELIVRTGHAAIVIAYECGNDGWWYYSELKSYPLTGKIFCEVSKSNQTTTRTTTRSLTTISTTTPTNINQCTGCNQNILKRNLTSGMENGIVSFQENIVSGCQVITIWCSGADPSTVNYTLLTAKSDLHKLTKLSERNGSEQVGIRLICGKDALWYFEHYTINNPSTHVMDTILCGVTRNRSSTPGGITTATTTTLPNEVFTTTSSTTTTTSSSSMCDKNKKYKILSSKVDSSFSTKGKFGGFYKLRSACRNICTQSYGMFKCVAFMYEPKNHGKCTIFESAVDGMIIENTKSNAVVAKKCF